MGRHAKHSVEAVQAVCESLYAEGRYTISNVRDRLGGGSYAYLARICLPWQAQRQQAADTSLEELLPESFRGALGLLLNQVREQGRKEAAEAAEETRRQLSAALAEIEQHETREEAWQDAVDAAEAHAQSCKAEAQQCAAKYSAEQQTRAAQYDVLETELSGLKGTLSETQVSRAGSDARLKQTVEELSHLREELKTMRAEHEFLIREAAEHRERSSQQAHLIAYLKTDIELKATEISAQNGRLCEERQRYSEAMSRSEAAERRAGHLHAQHIKEVQRQLAPKMKNGRYIQGLHFANAKKRLADEESNKSGQESV